MLLVLLAMTLMTPAAAFAVPPAEDNTRVHFMCLESALPTLHRPMDGRSENVLMRVVRAHHSRGHFRCGQGVSQDVTRTAVRPSTAPMDDLLGNFLTRAATSRLGWKLTRAA